MKRTAYAKYQRQKSLDEFGNLQSELSDEHTIEQFSKYHFRVDGKIDVWPSGKKFQKQNQSVQNYNEIKDIFD